MKLNIANIQNLFGTSRRLAPAENSASLNVTGMANSMAENFATNTSLKSTTQADATTSAANGGVALLAYQNTRKPPNNHGHVATFSVGSNVALGTIANIGSNNGFLPVGPGQGSVFTQQKTLNQVSFYLLSPTVTPKTAPQRIPFINFPEP